MAHPQTQTDTHTQTDRQTDRHTDTQTHRQRQTDTQTDREDKFYNVMKKRQKVFRTSVYAFFN